MKGVKGGALTKKFFRILLVFLFSVLLNSMCWAQGDDDDPGQDPDLPIDGGVVVLIAAGVGYGLKKRTEAKQRKENQNSHNTKEFTEDIEK